MNTEPTLGRRRMLGVLAGAGVVALGACRTDSNNADSNNADSNDATGSEAIDTTPSAPRDASGGTYSVGEMPSGTAGPFPGDGTNGPNVLTQRGVARRDIRRSLSGSGTADGVSLDVALTIVEASTGKPIPGAAVYIWHTDRLGRYSLYEEGVTTVDYLRGVQAADSLGALGFTSIFPAAYNGRWPHIHFEVFDTMARATTGRNARKVSQLALPEAVSREVYATSGYEQSQRNMVGESLSTDVVFRDGFDLQLAEVTGSVRSGLTASLVIGV